MPGETQNRVFRFGVFEADEASGELRKNGIRIKLHSQPFKVLTMLLDRPSAVVTREEMRERLWGTGTFVDFDHGLNTAVNKIREALGDSASTPRYVETISGKGYRFLAPVTLQAQVLDSVVEPPGAAARDSGSPAKDLAGVKEPAGAMDFSRVAMLTAPHELPAASRTSVRTLLVLIQVMYLSFYLGALANLSEIHDIFLEASPLHATALISLLVITALGLIPIRLFLAVAVALDFKNLSSKFRILFPALLVLDLLWAVSPFLLIHHISTGLALGLSAPLVYLPFAQRSLVLMYSRER